MNNGIIKIANIKLSLYFSCFGYVAIEITFSSLLTPEPENFLNFSGYVIMYSIMSLDFMF